LPGIVIVTVQLSCRQFDRAAHARQQKDFSIRLIDVAVEAIP